MALTHFMVTDDGPDAVAAERWLVWSVCVADQRPGGCPYVLHCDCLRTGEGALCEVVGRYDDEALARRACHLRQIDLEQFDPEVDAEVLLREAVARVEADRVRLERSIAKRTEALDRREADLVRREFDLVRRVAADVLAASASEPRKDDEATTPLPGV